eukprot:7385505-Prymnesium_polylepis.2
MRAAACGATPAPPSRSARPSRATCAHRALGARPQKRRPDWQAGRWTAQPGGARACCHERPPPARLRHQAAGRARFRSEAARSHDQRPRQRSASPQRQRTT